MIEGKTVVVIMPARGGSQRLHRKNIYPVWGQPMLYWGINACKASKYVDEIYVSSEDAEILDIAEQCGANKIVRPLEYSEHSVFKQDVIVDAVKSLQNKPDIVISLQPNSPEVSSKDLDAAMEKFIKYNRNEIFTVNADLIQNAAFRIMKYDYVFQKSISTKCGVFVTNYRDVHTKEDVDFLENNRKTFSVSDIV